MPSPAGAWTGPKNPRWKGGRHKDSRGYIHIKMPSHPNARKSGYVFEHTLVMAEALGRPLEHHELIHHINRVKDDNRLENLRLMTNAEHMAHHLTERWNDPSHTPKGLQRRIFLQCVICHCMFQSRQAPKRTPKCCSIPCKDILRKILIGLHKSKRCKECGQYFYRLSPPSNPIPLFCTPTCFHAYRRKHLLDGTMRNRRMAPKTCHYCQKTFFHRGITQGKPKHAYDFCSRDCYHAERRNRLATRQLSLL